MRSRPPRPLTDESGMGVIEVSVRRPDADKDAQEELWLLSADSRCSAVGRVSLEEKQKSRLSL